MLYETPKLEILKSDTEDVICQSPYDDYDASGDWDE